ncbi:MAG TPA: alpha-amylase family glycosyl hydrolase [Pseudomonadota bacterium]|nr:alpha-amylase family glycosyl hydrolase [Pseudomonadota bacterium]
MSHPCLLVLCRTPHRLLPAGAQRRQRLAQLGLSGLLLLVTSLLACDAPMSPPPTLQTDGGTPQAPDLAMVQSGDDACTAKPVDDTSLCPVTFEYQPTQPATSIALAGEFNGWSTSATPLTGPDAKGLYRATLNLAPGLYGYKVVFGGSDWRLNERSAYRKYVGGTENSGLRVRNCRQVQVEVVPGTLQVQKDVPGRGSLSAQVRFVTSDGQSTPVCSVKSTLRLPAFHKSTGTTLPPLSDSQLVLAADRRTATLKLNDLTDGKYTVGLTANASGQDGETLLLPFWIEREKFSFADSPLYMAMTDRFVNGDGKNPGTVAGVRESANYQGGDLDGVRQKLEDGYFDRMGIRTLWLTPFYTQPGNAHKDQSGTVDVTAYHGYWPIRARQVDGRIGGDEALHSLVETAHRHGVRVLMDAVLNHVHEQHEYFQDPKKRSWFRTGCICGTSGCDWTEKRLSCLFASYMPDIDWTVTEASEQFIADTLYYLEEFDLDGLRVDAVKHVEDLAVWNLGTRVRERFEQSGTRYYLLGETAMGWNDSSIAGNRENYDTIKRYMGGVGLDGQFDFVWYHGIAYRVFAYDERRFLHNDYWTHASLNQFKNTSGGDYLMVNYLGSHDTSRFISMATYRDPAPGSPWNRGIVDNKWNNLPQPPPGPEPYDRLWLGMLNLMTLPGIPLLYYGDEYGEYGGGDPDNRHGMRFDAALSARESAQLQRTRALLLARAQLRGLRRGDLQTVLLGEDVYAYARPDRDPKQSALVVLSRLASAQVTSVPVVAELGWPVGTKLRERLSGETFTVTGSTLVLTVPARGGLVLAPE